VAGATVYYWVKFSLAWAIFGLGAVFVALSLLLLARRLKNPRWLELEENEVLLPHGRFHMRAIRIPYADIKWLRERVLAGRPVFYIATTGRISEISALLLPDIVSYQVVKNFIYSHALAAKRSSVVAEPPIEMAAEEFRMRKAALDRHLQHLGPVPWGIVFSLLLVIPLVAAAMILFLSVLPFTDFPSEDRASLRIRALWILGFCGVIVGSIQFATRLWRNRLREIDFRCPSCHQYLAGRLGKRHVADDRCATCGR
jgi:membrane protein YdbS with pleckstrin-like domain